MSYLTDVEKELRLRLGILRETPDDPRQQADAAKQRQGVEDALVKFVKEKIVESYKNGIEAAKQAKQGKRFFKTETKKQATKTPVKK